MKKEHVIVLVSSIIVALVSSSLFMLKKKKKVNKKNNGRKQYLLNLIKKFNPNIKIENAVTPPAQWYTNEVLFELEKKEIVMKSWHPVANIGQLNNVGDYISSEILGINYFLIVDRNKKIRAFYNTCRHKASKLVDTGIESSKGAKPKGNIKDIVCPYHGWHYSLDGKLVNARKMSNSIINYDDFSLFEINVHIWSIFVFINFDKTAKWIENSFSELEKRLSDSGLDKLTFHSSKVDIIDCNWKVYVDNYLDGGYLLL
jgi:choline monooxygenase